MRIRIQGYFLIADPDHGRNVTFLSRNLKKNSFREMLHFNQDPDPVPHYADPDPHKMYADLQHC